jgi:hypothetical protein
MTIGCHFDLFQNDPGGSSTLFEGRSGTADIRKITTIQMTTGVNFAN